jgi:hypothetical protein
VSVSGQSIDDGLFMFFLIILLISTAMAIAILGAEELFLKALAVQFQAS